MEAPACERKPYPSDLTDAQWQVLEPLVPAAKSGGRPARYARREVVNAILYVTRSGCAWRALPHDLPPWSLVHYYFWHRQQGGTWQQAHDALRSQERRRQGRSPHPSGAVLDSQSVRTTENGGLAAATEPLHPTAARGSTGASATCSWTRAASSSAAWSRPQTSATARARACLLHLGRAAWPRLSRVWADGNYGGPPVEEARGVYGLDLEVVQKPTGQAGFSVLARRWVVERTFAF